MGFLSSFPGLKQIDDWLLTTLHRAAFIPANATDLAKKLFRSTYTPAQNVIAVVRPTLTMRDTIRIAEKSVYGSLEQRIFDLLCLRTQMQTIMAEDRCKGFKFQLDQDFTYLDNQTQTLKTEIITYLRNQERIIPADTPNIDGYITNNSDKE